MSAWLPAAAGIVAAYGAFVAGVIYLVPDDGGPRPSVLRPAARTAGETLAGWACTALNPAAVTVAASHAERAVLAAVLHAHSVHEDPPPAGPDPALGPLPPAQDDPATSYRPRPPFTLWLSDDTITRGLTAVSA